MIQDFQNILRKHKHLDSNKHILLAVSGGVDSIVLFHLLQNIAKSNRPRLTIAHINHQLRPEADAEEDFVQGLANKYDIPFYSYLWKKSEHPKSGMEEAAREMRYAFFKEVMAESGADSLMTGHHQDDQVETILMKLARGSSLGQLTGIEASQPFNGGLLIRPLLSFAKSDIYDFAHQHQLTYVEDKTNQELDYSRNRFRNVLIPLLKEENEQFNQHMEQFSKDLTDLLAIAKEPIAKSFQELVLVEDKRFSFHVKEFFNYSEAMQRSLLQKILESLYEHSPVPYKTNYIEIIGDWLLTGEVNTQLDLIGDFIVKKDYNKVTFYRGSEASPLLAEESYLIEDVDEWVGLSPTESIGLFECDEGSTPDKEVDVMFLEEASLQLPLTIRHRKTGDRMTYMGLNGTKKIKDIFIDEKVPLTERDQAWLVEDAKGRIIWLISFRKMRLLSAEETDKLTYVLKYKKLKP